MQPCFYPPTEALRPFVQHYMLAHIRYDCPAEQAIKPMPPAPQQCLYFYPRGVLHTFHYGQQRRLESPASIIVGPQVSRVDLHFPPDHLVFCVAFWPGGLHRLLDAPVQELFDFSLDSRLLLGPAVEELSEQLAGLAQLPAPDYAAMRAVVETYLLWRARQVRRPVRPLDAVLPGLLSAGPGYSIDQLAHDACLSPRQLERNFRERMGLSPKLYGRIVRFDRAFRLKERQPDLDWLAVAVQCGYYDYRHLVRDFQEFAHVTPPRLLAAEAAHTRTVAGFPEPGRT